MKLTKDVTATRHPKHWGHPDADLKIDTQAIWYTDLFQQKFKTKAEFKYLVFDFSPRKNVKLVNVTVTNDSIRDLYGRKDELLHWVKTNNNNNDWEEIPSKWQCIYCPLKCFSRQYDFVG